MATNSKTKQIVVILIVAFLILSFLLPMLPLFFEK